MGLSTRLGGRRYDCCAGTAALGAFLFGQSAGLMAGIALAAIVMLGFEARVAKTDATVLATVVIAQGALASIWLASRKQAAAKWAPAVIFWVATAAGVLIKGPITPFVSLLTMGTLSLFYREWRWLKRLKPLSGILILLAIVLPWLILITLKSGGAFFNESVNKDFLSKVGDAQESHGAPPGYFALIFVVFIWPFGVLAIRGGLQALSRLREDPRLAFLIAWYIPFWLVTELIPTKLPHYILPAYPALLLMMAWAIDTGVAAQPYRGRWQIWVERLTLLGLAAATLGFMGAGLVLPYVMTGSFSLPGIIAFFTAAAAGVFASGLVLNHNLKRALQASATFAIITLTLLTWGVVPALTPIWLSPAIANAFNAAKPCDNSVLASASYASQAWSFLPVRRRSSPTVQGRPSTSATIRPVRFQQSMNGNTTPSSRLCRRARRRLPQSGLSAASTTARAARRPLRCTRPHNNLLTCD